MANEKKFGWPFGKQRISLKVDQSVTSYGQVGGVTAHTVNIGELGRQLQPAAREDLVAALKSDIGKFGILVAAGVGDGAALSADLQSAFVEAGWELGFVGSTHGQPFEGLLMYPANNRGAMAANAVAGTGIPSQVEPIRDLPGDDDLRIMIGY